MSTQNDVMKNRKEMQEIDRQIQALNLRRNALAPISSLPPEIMCMMFMLSSEMGRESRRVLEITHVCHQWRVLALGYPSLWARPPLSDPRGTEEFLRRAEGAPLGVSIFFTRENTKANIEASAIVLDQMHRIRTLSLIVEDRRPTRDVLDRLKKPAPLLEDLEISPADAFTKHIVLFDRVTPALRSVSCFHWRFGSAEDLTLFRNIRELSLVHPRDRLSIRDTASLLQGMPSIESLVLDQVAPEVIDLSRISPIPVQKLQRVEISDTRLIQCATMLAFLGLRNRPTLHLATLLPTSPNNIETAFRVIDPILRLGHAPPFASAEVTWEESDRFTISLWSTNEDATSPQTSRPHFSILLHTSEPCPLSLWCQYLPLSEIRSLSLDTCITIRSSRDMGWLRTFESSHKIEALHARKVAVQEAVETLGAHLMHKWDYMDEPEEPYYSDEDDEDEDSDYQTRLGKQDHRLPKPAPPKRIFPQLKELTLERWDLKDTVTMRSVQLSSVLEEIVKDRAETGARLSLLRVRCTGIHKPAANRLEANVDQGVIDWQYMQ
ncbi:hypothetical protein GLOTRDRAFT_134952 [Gloeophyllum trabeum ATCC 11539]|uniref:Uncharacterized protein n=1 Tax=Gloeophyllum trabeum (strain ATCC 11539 / FP-39264 / Madison 617) TaxID=670483 RepID=S7QLH9_GLOTA|nr:uncharacterized protein GLOTRDRAFT_134952 [Gloeophyllum trabeum ATCC 11539]EPQ60233.1 hypothetical protein GLOTRDRAFT_134952 [Gloeophyllum trabeum ATCC 11539]